MKKSALVNFAFFCLISSLGFSSVLSSNKASVASALYAGKYLETEKKDYIKYGESVNSRLADEGFVLLKNDGTLPLKKGSKISVVGKQSSRLALGGAGSGAGSITMGVTYADLYSTLVDAGYELNEDLKSFYRNNSLSGSKPTGSSFSFYSRQYLFETKMSLYSEELISSLDLYNDAIIQVISREGSEARDLTSIDARDYQDKSVQTTKHALELSDNEQDLFNEAKKHTKHMIIILNSSNVFECDSLMKDPKVSAILWVGNPGDVGVGAIGRILSGKVNPSGRTVDTWTRDFTKDPTYQNWSDNSQHNPALKPSEDYSHAPLDTMLASDGKPMMSFGTYKNYTDHDNVPYGADYASVTNPARQFAIDNKVVPGGVNGTRPASYVSYEEGVYLDYRYYETRYQDTLNKDGKDAADSWYDGEEGVVFPFGYGLSYTSFTQEIVKTKYASGKTLTEDTPCIEFSVKVTNTGSVAGKDAVQAYWKAPYIKGGIEKADHVLCAFDKTDLIKPGESQTINLKFYLQDVANYDAKDANHNNFKGYELDEGSYSLMIGKNAHEMYGSIEYKIKEGGIQYRNDRFTGHEVVNRFTDRGFYSSMPGENDIEFTEFSRADFLNTFPTHPTDEDRTVKEGSRYEEFLTHAFHLKEIEEDNNYEIIPAEAHKTKEDFDKAGWHQENETLSADNRTQLIEMKDVPFEDERWDSFINEFTWSEMMLILERNGMASPAINEIGKPRFSEGDGPQKFNIMWWVSSPIIAATFNPRLAHEQGEAIGMEAHIQNKSGWWGPGLNIHRSPFGGRNFEYYSADPLLMGKMAAQVIEAVTDSGVYVHVKHFAVNEQEKNRESGISFLNEQTLREIYLKSFQIVFEEAKPMGVMTSYNRIGLIEAGGNYPLLSEVLRGEWGFRGTSLSDMTHSNNANIDFGCYENVTQRILAGCNAQLDANGGFGGRTQCVWDSELNAPVYVTNGEKHISYSFWYAARRAMMEHMYVSSRTVAMNREVTRLISTSNLTATVGEDIQISAESLDVFKAGAKIEGLNLKSINGFSLNNRQGLPEGIQFSNGVISGSFKESGLYRFNVIANVILCDDAGYFFEMDVAILFVVDVLHSIEQEPVIEPDNPPSSEPTSSEPISQSPISSEQPSDPTEPSHSKGGCLGSISATSATTAVISLALAVIYRRKKEER